MKPLPDTRSRQPLRVFLVENHPDFCHFLQLYLQVKGHTVFCAQTVAEALEKLPGSSCDVLLSDIHLADGSGWQLLHRVRQDHPDIYAIAMSGAGLRADRELSRAAGFRHHLLKPFAPGELNALLEQAAQELALTATASKP